jgi:acyl-CoA reductase-like NAD-dependent aldehyde dehydrogenase
VPVFLKPGRQEPWTPLRLAAAFAAAGCPPEALGFYPTDHAGAAEILLRADRSLLFGDDATVAPWRNDPRIQLHGPGRSKVILGADALAGWDRGPAVLDLLAESILYNGGRSCLNASGVWVPAGGRGRELAEALAQRLAGIPALPLDHPDARLAAFPSAAAARRVSEWIDRRLEAPGAEDLTAAARGGGPRVVEVDGCAFLLPTLIRCSDPGHPLADVELLFPFASFVELPEEDLPGRLPPALKATALTRDERLLADLAACRAIDHLNLGPIPTTRTAPDQPHEGNLFEHLFRRRALREETAA